MHRLFSARPPSPRTNVGPPKIAIIGAGLTGIFASTHCIGYGFATAIFEAGGRDALGGIWSKVADTSSVRTHTSAYQFCPSVDRRTRHLDRQQIVGQLRKLWEEYGLDQRTKFNTRVNRVYKDDSGKWVINDISHGQFDGVIVAIGTCGDPQIPALPNRERFNGDILHVSQLRGKRVKTKKVLTCAWRQVRFIENITSASPPMLGQEKECCWIRLNRSCKRFEGSAGGRASTSLGILVASYALPQALDL